MPKISTPDKPVARQPRSTARKTPRTASAQPPPTGGPTRRGAPQPRSEALEARILQAAIDEFAEHGFSGARIEQISRRARTVDRMLYYYYGNKARLYRSVLERIYADLIDAQREVVTPDDPVEGMRQLIEHSWDHYVTHPNLVRLLVAENLLRGKTVRQSSQVRRSTLPLIQTISTVLANGQAAGVFRKDVTSEHVLMTIMSLGFFYISNQYTCSSWIGVDLMTRSRRAKWRAHICTVVLDYLRAAQRT